MAREKGAAVAQIALAWLLTDPVVTLPIVGASNPARLRENALAAEIQLSESERAYLNLEKESC
jgi:aryl-alcohol dehydrogenase-like predicted oxidoreductase